MNAIIRGDECQGPHQVGAKGWSLACAQRAGLCVPAWFAVTPAALRSIDGAPSDALRGELATAVSELCPDARLVAVRSSALDEDGARLSFAGQLESFLFVPGREVADRVARVWRSASSLRLAAYRERLAGAAGQGATAVLVQRMVQAHAAGVAFSADPVSGRRAVAVVAAGSGVATGIVSGERDADTWHIGRCGRIESRSIAGTQPCITDDQAHEVAALARLCERCFGVPQDIEWAYEEGQLWLLQSRPITSIAALPDPDGEIALWDSSNIAESYGGVVTALTFSYIRRNYEHVYRELCRLAGVGSEALAGSDDALRRMLGLMRGRVYYNLLSWYRLLALVPGFAHNRRFLDQMLGVREEATRAVLEEVVATARRVTPRPALAFATQAARMAALLATVERRNRRFRQRLDDALEAPEVLLEDMRTDELVAHFRALDRRLLDRWDAPLVNDFFAMVYHGLLRRLAERWCATRAHGLANDLLAGQTDIVSLEPVQRIREMALVAAAHPDLARELREGERESILARLRQVPELGALYEDYLRLFGDRCFEELKLESATLETDPLPLLRAVGHLAANPVRENATACAAQVRGAAEGRVRAALRSHPLRRIAFGWVLRNARARVGDRENLRFDRTRLFGRVRRIFVEIGRRFHALGLLESPHDIFHLELDEIVRFVEGGATCTDLKGLAAVRKAQFTRHQRYEPPPDRFETRGVACHGDHGVRPHRAPGGGQGGEERQATGCCPGVVRGRARIVSAPEAALLKSGEILIAERTDPGWVMLFAAASGLVVERGSLLSHAAIVARELGIPAVIGLRDACRWLADGDLIEVDGESGVVRRLERSGARSAA